MAAKEITVNGHTYVLKAKPFKVGQWVRVYSRAKASSMSNNGPKAGDFGRVKFATASTVSVDFGVLSSSERVWYFLGSGGDNSLSMRPSVSLLRHCRKS